jgi:hypothetical protein
MVEIVWLTNHNLPTNPDNYGHCVFPPAASKFSTHLVLFLSGVFQTPQMLPSNQQSKIAEIFGVPSPHTLIVSQNATL